MDSYLKFFRKAYNSCPFDKVDKLRKIRNQIIHRGTQIDTKKREYFTSAIKCLIGVYEKEQINHREFLREIKQAQNEI